MHISVKPSFYNLPCKRFAFHSPIRHAIRRLLFFCGDRCVARSEWPTQRAGVCVELRGIASAVLFRPQSFHGIDSGSAPSRNPASEHPGRCQHGDAGRERDWIVRPYTVKQSGQGPRQNEDARQS